jgi:hypothetical protein
MSDSSIDQVILDSLDLIEFHAAEPASIYEECVSNSVEEKHQVVPDVIVFDDPNVSLSFIETLTQSLHFQQVLIQMCN